jgi:putative IMPACT (imprinted ancient) family translation regulator
MCQEQILTVDYSGIDSVQKYISTHPCSLLSSDYGEKVSFKIAVKKAEADGFISGLIDYMQGRVETQKGEEYYSPFKE